MMNLLSYTPGNTNDPLLGDLEKPQEWFSGIGFLEVFDLIFVVAILFGLGLYLMRRRAGKMIMGGVFVAVLLGCCILIGFPLLSTFAEAVFSSFLLVLLILYHDEVRDILRQIGCLPEKIGSFFKKRSARGTSKKTAAVIEEVCDAAMQMSESRTGALIVLKRASGLREYTTTGKTLNAEVSSALIRTIFYNGSPLHDGAMVIENGKIRATGCQLPPADPEGLDDSLGERHKAAIGISECTDAVAIVVSEETGTIS
ncbi:MAG: diadenylate cyclase, partial [Clostridia bacterium]|nr:diadenylate cyclase [Clostridia bacterium]